MRSYNGHSIALAAASLGTIIITADPISDDVREMRRQAFNNHHPKRTKNDDPAYRKAIWPADKFANPMRMG